MRAAIVSAVSSVTLLTLALTACGSPSSSTRPGQSAGQVDSNAIITVNNVEPSSDLTPSKVTDTAGWKLATLLFDGLVTFGDDGRLIYANADSITPNQDASAYTIKLKPGLRFSNGEPIGAMTYARAWSFAANVANGQTGGSIFSTIAGYEDLQNPHGSKDAILSGLSAPDASTLRVQLNAPDSSFPYKVGDVSFLPLPSVAYKDIAAFGRHPIGNGPYRFKSWTPNQSISLVKDPGYRGPRKVRNGGVTFRDYQSLEAAYADVEAGNLDVLDAVPVSSLATYRSEPRVQAFTKPGPAFKSLTIPSNLPHFQGAEGALRRAAISRSIDRAEVASKVFRGSVTPATDFTAPTIAGYSKRLNGGEVLSYDAGKARELWKRADAISPWSGVLEIAYPADGSDKDWVDALVNSVHQTLGHPSPQQHVPYRQGVQDRGQRTPDPLGVQLRSPVRLPLPGGLLGRGVRLLSG
ncbi:ABC-type transporter [Bifidobacterium actinocoloniiforme DSM 22766]|uniref:ABC-type transporter n=1 Tax=Bifidobacterium actinocoloniiforme DSM 22766 TaxID=1437605 RepID=A0A086Z1N1_9BIFI|nr:ABC transporter substrate-binding protein [Bifidobacterium actinocoloniiforme]KFI40431.1 ABC-type transporter [Bifidobacterium actinocoloniiforme DSM 22766]